MSDTLELLVFMPMDGDTLDAASALSWRGAPPTASWARTVGYVDLGDWECKNLPSLPSGPGLWLLRWEWTPTQEDGFDTVQYADTCEWSRPTMEELAVLGALPTPARAEGAGEVTEAQKVAGARALCDAFRVVHRDGDDYERFDDCTEAGKAVWLGLANVTLSAAFAQEEK